MSYQITSAAALDVRIRPNETWRGLSVRALGRQLHYSSQPTAKTTYTRL